MGAKRKELEDGEAPAKEGAQAKVSKHEEKRLIIVLESAHLESCKTGKEFSLLNIDEHRGLLSRNGRDFSTARPDITHQVFIRTANNVLIEINPATRIPRTFKRFAGLMVQLLHKYHITAAESSVKLIKVIKNPITDHLPPGCRKILMSYSSTGKPVKPATLVPAAAVPICIVVGAIAKGAIETDYTEENISISNYPLSAALTCSKLCDAFEEAWGIF